MLLFVEVDSSNHRRAVKKMHQDMGEFPWLWPLIEHWVPGKQVSVLVLNRREQPGILEAQICRSSVLGVIKHFFQLKEARWTLHQVSVTGEEIAPIVARTSDGIVSDIRVSVKEAWQVRHIGVKWDNDAPFCYIPASSPTVIRTGKGSSLNDLIFSDEFARLAT